MQLNHRLLPTLGAALCSANVALAAGAGGSTAAGPGKSLELLKGKEETRLFKAGRRLPSRGEPLGVVSADFDGDGADDLAVGNRRPESEEPGRITVLLGNGKGRFQPIQDIPVGQSPSFMITADFDGDGHLDIAAGDPASGAVSVLLGESAGTFALSGAFPAGSDLVDLTAGDFDDDGNMDVASVHSTSSRSMESTVSILRGNGDGDLGSPQSFELDFRLGAITAADFNADGATDLATAGAGRLGGDTTNVLLGNGDGSFRAPRQINTLGDQAIVAADVNADGIIDLATDGSVLLGEGDGTFEPSLRLGISGQSLQAGDFNGDGHLDFAGVGPTAQVTLGKGNGLFESTRSFAANGRSLAVADFDSDGALDIATEASLLRGDGKGGLAGAAPPLLPNRGFRGVAQGDFDEDGNVDLAVAREEFRGAVFLFSWVSIFLGNGDGSLREERRMDAPKVDEESTLVAGDFLGDSSLDLAFTGQSSSDMGTVGVLRGEGTGDFAFVQELSTDGVPAAMIADDLNGDGRLDLATVSSETESVTVLLQRSEGGFGDARIFDAGASSVGVAAADFDGDGIVDLATANPAEDTVTLLHGRGDGVFRAPRTFPAGSGPGTLIAADLDADGVPDLAAAQPESASVSVLLGDGAGGFHEPQSFAVGESPTDLIVDDLDRDGIPDLATADNGSAQISVLLGMGNGAFQRTSAFDVRRPFRLVSADFDGNGAPDLATNLTSVLLNTGASDVAGPAPAGFAGAWFDAARSGEGLVLEILPDDRARVSWFTYTPNGEQAWIVGNGRISGDGVLIDNAVRGRGGRFGDDFDPSAIEFEQWGSISLLFEDCESLLLRFDGPPAYGSGRQRLERLTRIAGQPCPQIDAVPDSLGISGAWFDPERSGEGLVVEELPDGRARVSWFTYRPEGGQAWMIGNGPIEGNRVVIDNAFITDGGAFGEAFDAGAIELVPWGELALRFTACDRAVLDFEPAAGSGFPADERTLTLTRLTHLAGSQCRL